MAKEYRRTCRACGNVWHSLVGRERAVAASGCFESYEMCTSSGSKSAQHSRNWDAESNELNRLRTCPSCGSSAYDEEVVEY